MDFNAFLITLTALNCTQPIVYCLNLALLIKIVTFHIIEPWLVFGVMYLLWSTYQFLLLFPSEHLMTYLRTGKMKLLVRSLPKIRINSNNNNSSSNKTTTSNNSNLENHGALGKRGRNNTRTWINLVFFNLLLCVLSGNWMWTGFICPFCDWFLFSLNLACFIGSTLARRVYRINAKPGPSVELRFDLGYLLF